MSKKTTRIWGLYTSMENPELLDILSEYEIWKRIYVLDDKISLYENDRGNRRNDGITEDEILEDEYNLDYLVYYTRKFGVEFDPKPTNNRRVPCSESFRKWTAYWLLFEHKLYETNQYAEFIEKLDNGEDVSEYMPSEGWNDSLSKTRKKSKHNRKK